MQTFIVVTHQTAIRIFDKFYCCQLLQLMARVFYNFPALSGLATTKKCLANKHSADIITL